MSEETEFRKDSTTYRSVRRLKYVFENVHPDDLAVPAEDDIFKEYYYYFYHVCLLASMQNLETFPATLLMLHSTYNKLKPTERLAFYTDEDRFSYFTACYSVVSATLDVYPTEFKNMAFRNVFAPDDSALCSRLQHFVEVMWPIAFSMEFMIRKSTVVDFMVVLYDYLEEDLPHQFRNNQCFPQMDIDILRHPIRKMRTPVIRRAIFMYLNAILEGIRVLYIKPFAVAVACTLLACNNAIDEVLRYHEDIQIRIEHLTVEGVFRKFPWCRVMTRNEKDIISKSVLDLMDCMKHVTYAKCQKPMKLPFVDLVVQPSDEDC